MQEVLYNEGMTPGRGINQLTGDISPSLAVTGNLKTIEIAHGQTVTSTLMRVDDWQSLHKELGIDVKADGNYAGFSGSAKFAYADKCSFNSQSTFIVIHITVKNAFQSLDNPVLCDEGIDLLKKNKSDRFRERFGDVFITGISTGGEYIAIYSVTSTSNEEQESVSVDVELAYRGGIANADLNTSIKTAMSKKEVHTTVNCFTYQCGGKDTSQDQTPGDIMEKAKNFAPSVADEFSVPYSVLPASYRSLALPEDAVNPIDIQNQKDVLADNWKLRNDLMVLKNDIDYILLSVAEGYDEFENPDVKSLQDGRNSLVRQIDHLTKQASACMNDAKACELSTFETTMIVLPKRKINEKAPADNLIGNWTNPDTGSSFRSLQFIYDGQQQLLATGVFSNHNGPITEIADFNLQTKTALVSFTTIESIGSGKVMKPAQSHSIQAKMDKDQNLTVIDAFGSFLDSKEDVLTFHKG